MDTNNSSIIPALCPTLLLTPSTCQSAFDYLLFLQIRLGLHPLIWNGVCLQAVAHTTHSNLKRGAHYIDKLRIEAGLQPRFQDEQGQLLKDLKNRILGMAFGSVVVCLAVARIIWWRSEGASFGPVIAVISLFVLAIELLLYVALLLLRPALRARALKWNDREEATQASSGDLQKKKEH